MSEASSPPRWAIVTWILLLGAIGALLVFASWYGAQKREREVRLLLFANSRLPAGQLADCLETRMPLTMERWTPVDGEPRRIVNWNVARGLRITVINAASRGRRIEIATPDSRPLRLQEAQALRRCLAGG